jgi:SPRY domain
MFSAAKTAGPSGYNINNSLRFRSSASASLNRTPASAGNRQKWTWSGWMKRGTFGAGGIFFAGGTVGSTTYDTALFNGESLGFNSAISGVAKIISVTSAVFRDPSAWYHIVYSIDTTQATGTNGVKIYVNGIQQTVTVSTYTQNTNTSINNNVSQDISRLSGYGAEFFDGYLTEVNFVDGQQLTPSSFGSTNATTGVWQPAKYTGTYGTNGFYLKFSNIALTSGSNTGLGQDFSGNGNYWNTNNISVTAGTTYDAMTDVPTLTSATVANYATLNPIDKNFGNAGSIVDGNLGTTSQTSTVPATFYLSSGKWYFEASFSSITGVSSLVEVGIRNGTPATGQIQGYLNNGNKDVETTQSAYGATYTTGDIIGCAFDLDAKSITFYKNGTSQGSFTYTTADLYTPCLIARGTTTYSGSINFGQRPFSYTPPSGYLALNAYNLPTSTIVQGNKYMDATIYTANGGVQTITNTAGFLPDLVWTKTRSTTGSNYLMDSVRGASKDLYSNLTNAEVTDANYLTSFNSNGFSIGTSNYSNGTTMVGWQWQAGQGSSSSNTNGTITSTVSVNATAGFSVVTYTAPASGTGTVGHGLNVAPAMIILKSRASVANWTVYHQSIGNTGGLALNLTNATNTTSGYWNNTSPTSSVFTSGTSFNGLTTMVAYCWSEIAGFSKFGSYTGNGSADGPFVYTGFRPKFVLIKSSTNIDDWYLYDTSRNTYNLTNLALFPDLSNAESTGVNAVLDILSNGFKLRGTANINSAQTYIYMAFAENPFKNALAR